MNYSLSNRQPAEYLRKADEIAVEYRDIKALADYIDKYPGKKFNLILPIENIEINWDEIVTCYELSRHNFVIGIINGSQMREAKNREIPFYHRAMLHSFHELRDLSEAGASEVYLGAPLFFQLDRVKQNFPDIKIRAIANSALPEGSMAPNNGVCGTWIRPEDVNQYDEYIDTIEFYGEHQAVQALYRIYAEKHAWSGKLCDLVKDLNHNAVNRMVPPTLAEARITCGQRCQENNHCHLCQRLLDLADPEKWKNYLASQSDN